MLEFYKHVTIGQHFRPWARAFHFKRASADIENDCWWTGACVLSDFSHTQLFATLWTVVCQAPLSMGLSRQEYWSGLSCPPPGDLPNPGTEPESLMSPALAGMFFPTSATWEALMNWYLYLEYRISIRCNKTLKIKFENCAALYLSLIHCRVSRHWLNILFLELFQWKQ